MTVEDRVAEILADWSELRQRGELVDPDDVIRAHPDLSEELREGFAALEYVDAAVGRSPDAARTPERIGPYRVERPLGVGGMGTVYLCQEDGKPIALKVIHPHLLQTPGFFKRFLREAELGRRVEHENVVRTLDVDAIQHGGRDFHYLVMEYVEGQTLREMLEDLDRVPEGLCRHIGTEIARALAAIHGAGAIHRDLKPENVLITDDHLVKVMDLGVARLVDERLRLSQTGAFVGSVLYAAPEQFRREGEDGRTDLYALGVLLYELATGEHPYRAEDASRVLRNVLDGSPRRAGSVNSQLSAFFEEVVHTLLAKDPADRFATAAALVDALDQAEKSEWWKERARVLRIETKRPLRRIRIPRETALYGRDEDLARLHALYDDAKGGDGRVLLIEGEAGIGKTRLVDELVGRLRREGEDVNFLFGSYPPGGAATAAGAFSEAYREQFGAEGLEDSLREVLTPTPILVSAFAAVLRGETTPKDAEPLTRDSLQTVFVHATRGLAAERTTIVLIDDLHFAPGDGRALFASLALAVPGHRVLLIGTMRPGVSEDWIANVERLDHASRTVLPRLGPKDLTRLLKDAFRSERLAAELAFRIAEKSDGNPFFTFEIIRGLREGQFITQQPDGTWVTTRIIEEIEVPSSVIDLVNARVADLADDERNFLDVASCIGFAFDPRLVAAVLGLPAIPALQMVARIEKRHRLVRSAGEGFVFDHHQVQEALYGGLSAPLREEYHAAVAETLEARNGAGVKEPEEIDGPLRVDLCEHFLAGRKGGRALRYLGAALEHLQSGYQHAQAVALADRALAVPGLLEGGDRIDLLLDRDSSLEVLGHRAAQQAGLSEASDLARGADKTTHVRLEGFLGRLRRAESQFGEAQVHFERYLGLAREVGDLEREAHANLSLGATAYYLGDYESTTRYMERALTISRSGRWPLVEYGTTFGMGMVHLASGRVEEARDRFEQALEIAREIGDRRQIAEAGNNLGCSLQTLGALEEALGHYRRSLTIHRETGNRLSEGAACLNLGNALWTARRSDEARDLVERSLAIAVEIGDREGEALAWGALGGFATALGQLATAREAYERMLAGARETEDPATEGSAWFWVAQTNWLLGRLDQARDQVKRSLEFARDIGHHRNECRALALSSALALEADELEQAREWAGLALTRQREIGDTLEAALSLERLGAACVRAGRSSEAREALEEAAASLHRMKPMTSDLARVLAMLACLPGGDVRGAESALEGAGEVGPGTRYHLWKATGKREHLVEAKRLLDDRVEHAPEECRESMIRNVRLNREIMEAWRNNL